MMPALLAEIINACFPGAAIQSLTRASGGDIHRSAVVELAGGGIFPTRVFVKSNTLDNAAILQSEFESLRRFEEYPDLHYPRPLHFICDKQSAYLIMECHSIQPLDDASAHELGAMLALQHQVENSDYGWPQQNFIGATPQFNQSESSWARFFRLRRLEPQLQFAAANGMTENLCGKIETVCGRLEHLLATDSLRPVLLHGDLWSGNAGFDDQAGKPILFDPAPYFGAAEADLAMTELFGRFPQSFYEAYHSVLELQPGYPLRRAVYNLYHALNHFNLFGGGYLNLVENQLRIINLEQLS